MSTIESRPGINRQELLAGSEKGYLNGAELFYNKFFDLYYEQTREVSKEYVREATVEVLRRTHDYYQNKLDCDERKPADWLTSLNPFGGDQENDELSTQGIVDHIGEAIEFLKSQSTNGTASTARSSERYKASFRKAMFIVKSDHQGKLRDRMNESIEEVKSLSSSLKKDQKKRIAEIRGKCAYSCRQADLVTDNVVEALSGDRLINSLLS